MKHFMKFISVALVAAVMISMSVPAVKTYAAKEFTYAEQKTKAGVTQLEMKPEEQVDLCFLGAPDYSKYKRNWVSTNEDVATVDNMGVITAKAQGTAKISLVIGDGTVYISEPVEVTVVSMNLTVGNSSDKAMDILELKKGMALDLNFYGVTDWSARKNVYLTEWISSDESVVTVEQSTGVITAEEEGISIVVFQIYDKERNILLSSSPVTVIVTK